MPLPVDRPIPEAVQQRAVNSFVLDPGTWCHISTYSVASHGYAQIGWFDRDLGRNVGTTAHRAAYTARYGVIPDGMTVDHICREKRCVNPAHLRVLSNVANAADNGNARKTHCLRGHPFDEANTYVSRLGHRYCRACKRYRRAR